MNENEGHQNDTGDEDEEDDVTDFCRGKNIDQELQSKTEDCCLRSDYHGTDLSGQYYELDEKASTEVVENDGEDNNSEYDSPPNQGKLHEHFYKLRCRKAF